MMIEAATHAAGTEPPVTLGVEETGLPERRRQPRMNLHLHAWFWLDDRPDPIQATTVNISSDGLYCLANATFLRGNFYRCILFLPAHHPQCGKRRTALD